MQSVRSWFLDAGRRRSWVSDLSLASSMPCCNVAIFQLLSADLPLASRVASATKPGGSWAADVGDATNTTTEIRSNN
jgi:hypothetical protein